MTQHKPPPLTDENLARIEADPTEAFDVDVVRNLVAHLRALRKAVGPFAFIVEWAFSGGKTLPDDESKVDIRVKAGDLRRLAELMEVK